jgi:glycosyltransferase involved in cell wall biosynthesis
MSLLSFRPGRIGGAETYVRQLVSRLPEVAPGDELLLAMDDDVARGLPSPGWERVLVASSPRSIVAARLLEAYTPWRAGALERLFARLRADVLFFPQQSIFPFRADSPAVLTVGDVQHLFLPENFGIFDRTFRSRVYPRSLARARHIIAVSESTRRALVERCGILPDKVTVVPHGIEPLDPSEAAAVSPTELVEGPYLFYPAATYAHKGHERLFRSYAALKKRGDLPEKLVLTGERTKLWRRRLVPLARKLGIEADVAHLGFVPYPDLRRLYAGASAVVFPTLYEGFGLPVLEAAQFGKRIVTSRLGVFGEVGVPPRFQIDFGNPEAFLRALREQGSAALEKEPVTWRECARRTLEIVRRAASASSTQRP